MGEAEDHRRLDRHQVLMRQQIGDGTGSSHNWLRVSGSVLSLQVRTNERFLGGLQSYDGSVHAGGAVRIPCLHGGWCSRRRGSWMALGVDTDDPGAARLTAYTALVSQVAKTEDQVQFNRWSREDIGDVSSETLRKALGQ